MKNMTPRARGTLLLNSLGGVMILAVVAALCMASGLFGEALEGEGLSWKLIGQRIDELNHF